MRKIFRLFVTCENAAFEEPAPEIVRILRHVADRIERGDTFDHYRTILDINGNDVGRFAIKDE